MRLLATHGHIGFSSIVSDYVPKPARGAARTALAALTLISILGLLKCNTMDKGITGTVKQMWTTEEQNEKK